MKQLVVETVGGGSYSIAHVS